MSNTENTLNLGFTQKILVKLGFNIFTEYKRKQESSNVETPFFAFYCPIHGIVESYKHGWKHVLICPKCVDEETNPTITSMRTIIFFAIGVYVLIYILVFFIKMFFGGS